MVKAALLARRARLRRLIADLAAELRELEDNAAEQAGAKRTLTQNFFWMVLAPILADGPDEGMTTVQLHSEMVRVGRQVPSGRFRVFLNRMKQKGWIDVQMQPTGTGGRWRLTLNARQLLMTRLRK